MLGIIVRETLLKMIFNKAISESPQCEAAMMMQSAGVCGIMSFASYQGVE